jgi:hypothetical protein
LIFIVPGGVLDAQTRQPTNWDFTYTSLLERNNVGKDELIRQWLAGIKSPAEQWITRWKGKPITSSILIEYPAFHAAERQTIWLVRTADGAHYWELTESLGSTKWAEEAEVEEPIQPRLFDDFYAQATTWEELAPKPRAELPEQVFPGYMGFISLYGPEDSRQMLLTFDDFIQCPQKACAPGKAKAGRLMSALEPLLTPESRKNYEHKSESEIARMTPEQRIDEQILEDDIHPLWNSRDDTQSEMIPKYRRLDGAKGLPHIARLIDSYHPKRKRSDRSHAALMMASQIDERVVRLRASAGGREVIAAIERLAVRSKDPDSTFQSIAETTLKFVSGANMTDEAIQNSLWLQHRIKLSEQEMLRFTNFLISRDPTYPSWSEQKFERISDAKAREVNDLGVPVTQIFVMKNPQRFYQPYLTFKQHRIKEESTFSNPHFVPFGAFG